MTCLDKGIDKIYMNCFTCNKSNWYTYFSKSNNSLNCKSQGKYVNYEQTGCIDSILDGYYDDHTEINTIDKCNQNCLTCSEGSTNAENMKCLSCDYSKSKYPDKSPFLSITPFTFYDFIFI